MRTVHTVDHTGIRSLDVDRVTEKHLLARLAAWMAASLCASTWFADPDLWGHLRFGLDAIGDGSLTAVDPYSFTSDSAWINHEWLSEVLLGLAYLFAGVPGLMISKVVVVVSAYAVMAWRLRNTAAPARWWVLALTIVAAAPLTITWRPQVWTVLALSIVTATVDWPLKRKLLVWPLIFALWANLHGGWIVGLGVVGAWSLGTAIDARDWRRLIPLTALLALCTLATLVTPYGLELWAFIWRTVGFDRSDIAEWHSVWKQGRFPFLWLLPISLLLILLRSTTWSWASMLPVAMLVVASFRVGRLSGLFAILVLTLMGSRWRGAAPVFTRPMMAMLALASAIPFGYLVKAQSACLTWGGPRAPDTEVAGALSGLSGKLMLPMGWGQYAIWHFSPGLRVSFDGRRETVYSQARIAELHGLVEGDLRLMPLIERERPEYVWTERPEGEIVAGLLMERGYRRDIITDRSIMQTRADVQPLTRRALSACFP